MASCSLEESIRRNLWLILHNQVQGIAKPEGVAADPEFGADLPHHEFRQGHTSEVTRTIRVAIRKLEPRLDPKGIKIDYAKTVGRYLPFNKVRIQGTVLATGKPLDMEFEIEE